VHPKQGADRVRGEASIVTPLTRAPSSQCVACVARASTLWAGTPGARLWRRHRPIVCTENLNPDVVVMKFAKDRV
jgi:hypothetical protein